MRERAPKRRKPLSDKDPVPTAEPVLVEPRRFQGKFGTYVDDGIRVCSEASIERDNAPSRDYRAITESLLISMESLDWMSGVSTNSEFWRLLGEYLDNTWSAAASTLSAEEISQIPFCGYAEAETMMQQEYIWHDDWHSDGRHIDATTKAAPVAIRPLFYDSALQKFRFVAVTTPHLKKLCLWVDDQVLERMRKNKMLHEPQVATEVQSH